MKIVIIDTKTIGFESSLWMLYLRELGPEDNDNDVFCSPPCSCSCSAMANR